MSGRIILVFDGGAVLTTRDSMNKYDIDGKEPIKVLEATEENIKEYFSDEERKKDKPPPPDKGSLRSKT